MKLQYSCSIAVLTSFLPHKKFTWTDFGDIYIPIYPRRYAPGANRQTQASGGAKICLLGH